MVSDKKHDDLVSIIVPIYNVAQYLERCISSLLNQSYSKIEIILVDDGSTDSCPDICENFKSIDTRINVIHKKNGGLSDARNVGIKHANGEWYVFVDSDDCVAPNFVEVLYNLVSEYECEIAGCSFSRFSEKIPETPIFDSEKISIYSGLEMLNRIYSSNHQTYLESTVAWNKIYSKNLFDNTEYPKGKIHEDEATTYKLYYLSEKVAWIDCGLYYYFQNQSGIMGTKFSVKRLDYLDALYERYLFFKEHDLPLLADITINRLYIYFVDYFSIEPEKVCDFDDFYNRLVELYKLYRKEFLVGNLCLKTKIRVIASYLNLNALTMKI